MKETARPLGGAVGGRFHGRSWSASVPQHELLCADEEAECQLLRERVAKLEQIVSEGLQQEVEGWSPEAREWLNTAHDFHLQLSTKYDVERSLTTVMQQIVAVGSEIEDLEQRKLILRSKAADRREMLSRQIRDYDEQRAELEERAADLNGRSRMMLEQFHAHTSTLLAETDELRSEVKQAMTTTSVQNSSYTALDATFGTISGSLLVEDIGAEDDTEDDWDRNSALRSVRRQMSRNSQPSSGDAHRLSSIDRISVPNTASTQRSRRGSAPICNEGAQPSMRELCESQLASLCASQRVSESADVTTCQSSRGSVSAPCLWTPKATPDSARNGRSGLCSMGHDRGSLVGRGCRDNSLEPADEFSIRESLQSGMSSIHVPNAGGARSSVQSLASTDSPHPKEFSLTMTPRRPLMPRGSVHASPCHGVDATVDTLAQPMVSMMPVGKPIVVMTLPSLATPRRDTPLHERPISVETVNCH